MNSAHALTAENLLRALPEVLRNDESMAALAASVAQVLAQRPEEIQRLAIYPRIDELPEELLDILPMTSRWTGGMRTTPWRKSAGR